MTEINIKVHIQIITLQDGLCDRIDDRVAILRIGDEVLQEVRDLTIEYVNVGNRTDFNRLRRGANFSPFEEEGQ